MKRHSISRDRFIYKKRKIRERGENLSNIVVRNASFKIVKQNIFTKIRASNITYSFPKPWFCDQKLARWDRLDQWRISIVSWVSFVLSKQIIPTHCPLWNSSKGFWLNNLALLNLILANIGPLYFRSKWGSFPGYVLLEDNYFQKMLCYSYPTPFPY